MGLAKSQIPSTTVASIEPKRQKFLSLKWQNSHLSAKHENASSIILYLDKLLQDFKSCDKHTSHKQTILWRFWSDGKWVSPNWNMCIRVRLFQGVNVKCTTVMIHWCQNALSLLSTMKQTRQDVIGLWLDRDAAYLLCESWAVSGSTFSHCDLNQSLFLSYSPDAIVLTYDW